MCLSRLVYVFIYFFFCFFFNVFLVKHYVISGFFDTTSAILGLSLFVVVVWQFQLINVSHVQMNPKAVLIHSVFFKYDMLWCQNAKYNLSASCASSMIHPYPRQQDRVTLPEHAHVKEGGFTPRTMVWYKKGQCNWLCLLSQCNQEGTSTFLWCV